MVLELLLNLLKIYFFSKKELLFKNFAFFKLFFSNFFISYSIFLIWVDLINVGSPWEIDANNKYQIFL